MIEHLNQIRGKLCITHIETLQSIEEAESAKLCNKSELQSLALQWSSSVCESSKDAKKDELVLGKLQLHQNLNMLTVDGYRGTRFPNWVMELQHFLPNLIQITLCNLSHCKQLPPFQHLINLEIMEIHSAYKIKWIQTDLQASSGSFKKLKILSIRDMPDLEEWSITGLTDDTKLDKLEINRCPHVIFKPCLPSAKTSVIIESSMSLSSGSVASLSLQDLLRASAEILGKGNFGTTYKANLEKGQVVVVKRLRMVNVAEREFRDKISVIGAMNHPNLLPLVAFYYSNDEKLLVYDFMPLGSLSSWLHASGMKDSGQPSLNWSTRSRIALAVARGLKYIHAISPQCAHGSIRGANILLSGNNGFPEEAKIADHGLAHLIGGAADGYKAPELIDFHGATQKSDVYSFGVLIMELLTARDPWSIHKSGSSLPGWVQKNFHRWWLDAVLLRENQMAQQKMMKMMQLAMECVSSEPERRPTMQVVVHQIEDICKLMKDRPDGTGSSIDDTDEGPSTRTDL